MTTHRLARVYGEQRLDGMWEGWLDFVGIGTTAVLRTPIETTQRAIGDLAFWARGLQATYLRGAFRRAEQVSGT